MVKLVLCFCSLILLSSFVLVACNEHAADDEVPESNNVTLLSKEAVQGFSEERIEVPASFSQTVAQFFGKLKGKIWHVTEQMTNLFKRIVPYWYLKFASNKPEAIRKLLKAYKVDSATSLSDPGFLHWSALVRKVYKLDFLEANDQIFAAMIENLKPQNMVKLLADAKHSAQWTNVATRYEDVLFNRLITVEGLKIEDMVNNFKVFRTWGEEDKTFLIRFPKFDKMKPKEKLPLIDFFFTMAKNVKHSEFDDSLYNKVLWHLKTSNVEPNGVPDYLSISAIQGDVLEHPRMYAWESLLPIDSVTSAKKYDSMYLYLKKNMDAKRLEKLLTQERQDNEYGKYLAANLQEAAKRLKDPLKTKPLNLEA
ncbi:hypothetical protein CCR75_001713 [Bremia lactucae]|uniref:RxLR effector protein n=1 Tax=Bremia lactucae TaxID=4779 RepID=A0A976FGD7_BRELC|nr:hypothetical protein CCR75_001713 [Bremia lactucae]